MKQYAITAVVVVVAMAIFFSVFKLTNTDKTQAFGLSLMK